MIIIYIYSKSKYFIYLVEFNYVKRLGCSVLRIWGKKVQKKFFNCILFYLNAMGYYVFRGKYFYMHVYVAG